MSGVRVIVANVITPTCSLRAEIEGWTYEDSRLFVFDKPIGMTPAPRVANHKTVLEMLACGFRLVSAPEKETYDTIGPDGPVVQYSWWLQKEVT